MADKNMDERHEKRQWGKAIAQMNGCGSLCLFLLLLSKIFRANDHELCENSL
ncbi:hypothetical protein PNH38_15860 [Anoxybacillus rupiensis]|uniref:Uncharacterized protein n=1 Tax=Anoxybacteroides rupiense TaxID=311460 RepID=A0ABT5W904_9BACL|nr:hypothetical protein [Anoxybacillus rupiensis]